MSGRAERWAFTGEITGVGSTSGTRVVVGHWRTSPLGAFADAMVETAEGHRVLIAPRDDVAELVASTYDFDEVRVEPLECVAVPTWLTFASPSLRLAVGVGDRTWLGRALRAVPAPVATAPAWTAVTDPLARLTQQGVRTRGRTRSGGETRREFYGATDQHAVRLGHRLVGGPAARRADAGHRRPRPSGSPPPRAGPPGPPSCRPSSGDPLDRPTPRPQPTGDSS